MPKGWNPDFIAKVGDASLLPGKDVPRGVAGRFDTPRAQMGREHALDILNDPDYRANLKTRMVAGEGGAIEVWIWRIGYGDPQKDEAEAERQKAHFEAVRAEVREFLRSHPHAANVIDAQVQGATKLLPRPRLVSGIVGPSAENGQPSIPDDDDERTG